MITSEQLATLQIEYPRRRQIFDESVSVIQKTNNPDILCRRFNMISEFVKWVYDNIEKGMPIKTDKTQDQITVEMASFYNYHSVRIAQAISTQDPSGKLNRLMGLQTSLMDAPNKEESFIKIAQIINQNLLK